MMPGMRKTVIAAIAASAVALTGSVLAGYAVHPAGAAAGGDLGACSAQVSLRGYDDELNKTTFGGVPVSELSGLDWDGHSLLAVDDSSYLWTLSAHTSSSGDISAAPRAVAPLKDENGDILDPEAIAVDRDGTRLITSEVEPSVRRYDRHGNILASLPVPARFRTQPAGQAPENGSFEGLTLLPGDQSLIASMEEPLSGDGTDADGNGPNRFLRWQRHGNGEFTVAEQYAFTVDKGLAISDIKAISPTKLLVLERGWTADAGNTVRLYEADLAGAQDVSDVDSLADTPVRQVHGRLLANLVDCPTAGATNPGTQTNPLLDNIEGMAFTGRHLPGGRRELLLVSDDNGSDTQVTRLYDLSVRV